MKYANIITLKELRQLTHLNNFIVVDIGTKEEITDIYDTEYRIDLIDSTSKIVPIGTTAFYEDKSEFKPEIYKKPNRSSRKEYCIATQVVVYVSKITNEVE